MNPIEQAWRLLKAPRHTTRYGIGDMHYDYSDSEPPFSTDEEGAEWAEGATPRREQLSFADDNDPMMQRGPPAEGEQFRNNIIKRLTELGDLVSWNSHFLESGDPHSDLYDDIVEQCSRWAAELGGGISYGEMRDAQ
tara:strand:+ start:3891 stop:4301 length:411 start_codon:yes stop_codon:yes gene_type:complete